MASSFSSNSSLLVVGADSLVGQALLRAYPGALGTSRRPDSSHWRLDLAGDPTTWQLPPVLEVAVLCAAVTRLADCQRDPVTSRAVNVTGAVRLAEKLVQQGVFVIYLSSDKVFDGRQPLYCTDEPYSPLTEYGRQKAEAERQLLQMEDRVAVLRLSKILGSKNPLFSDWRAALRNGEVIRPFSDMTLAPVPLAGVVAVLGLLAAHRLPGVWHFTGQKDVTYAEVARYAARLWGADETLIQPILAAESGLLGEPTSRYTSLNVDRLRLVFGIEAPDVWWTLEQALWGA